MYEFDGAWLVIIAAVLCAIVLIFFLRARQKRRRRLDYLNLQWERQNKDFSLSDHPDDGIGPVRIRIIEEDEQQTPNDSQETSAKAHWPKVLSLYVKAKPQQQFYGYDLMQAILNQGFVHGSMDFFHYSDGQQTLFSLAATEPPGGFNLDKMGALKTSGLCLFLQPHRFDKPEVIFDRMVETAKQIADDLGGVIEDEHHHLLTPERLNFWRASLSENPND